MEEETLLENWKILNNKEKMDYWEKLSSKEKIVFLDKLAIHEKKKLLINTQPLVKNTEKRKSPAKKDIKIEILVENYNAAQSIDELDFELAELGRMVEFKAEKVVSAAKTPLLSYHLSRGELWQVVNRRGLYALSPGSKIPLLCYLTDYTLTGVLEPGLVDIFNHGEKNRSQIVQSYIKEISRQWSSAFMQIVKMGKSRIYLFSVEFVTNLRKFLQSVYDQLHNFDPTLSALFYSNEMKTLFSVYEINFSFIPSSSSIIPPIYYRESGRRQSRVSDSLLTQKYKLSALEIGTILTRSKSVSIQLELQEGRMIIFFMKNQIEVSTIVLSSSSIKCGVVCFGDHWNVIFLYPVQGFRLTPSGSIVLPSLYGTTGEENRIVLFFNRSLQESVCEGLVQFLKIFLRGRMVEVDDDFAANLFKRINNCSKLFGSSKDGNDEFKFDSKEEKIHYEETKKKPKQSKSAYSKEKEVESEKYLDESFTGSESASSDDDVDYDELDYDEDGELPTPNNTPTKMRMHHTGGTTSKHRDSSKYMEKYSSHSTSSKLTGKEEMKKLNQNLSGNGSGSFYDALDTIHQALKVENSDSEDSDNGDQGSDESMVDDSDNGDQGSDESMVDNSDNGDQGSDESMQVDDSDNVLLTDSEYDSDSDDGGRFDDMSEREPRWYDNLKKKPKMTPLQALKEQIAIVAFMENLSTTGKEEYVKRQTVPPQKEGKEEVGSKSISKSGNSSKNPEFGKQVENPPRNHQKENRPISMKKTSDGRLANQVEKPRTGKSINQSPRKDLLKINNRSPDDQTLKGNPGVKAQHGNPADTIQKAIPAAKAQYNENTADKMPKGSSVTKAQHENPPDKMPEGTPADLVRHGNPADKMPKGNPVAKAHYGNLVAHHGTSQTPKGTLVASTQHGTPIPQTQKGTPIPQTQKGVLIPQTPKGTLVASTQYGTPIPQTQKGTPIPQTQKGTPVPQTLKGTPVIIPTKAQNGKSAKPKYIPPKRGSQKIPAFALEEGSDIPDRELILELWSAKYTKKNKTEAEERRLQVLALEFMDFNRREGRYAEDKEFMIRKLNGQPTSDIGTVEEISPRESTSSPGSIDQSQEYNRICPCRSCTCIIKNSYKLRNEVYECRCEDCKYTRSDHYTTMRRRGYLNHKCHVCHLERRKREIWTRAAGMLRDELEDCYCTDCTDYKVDKTRHYVECRCHRCKCMILIADVEVGNVKPFRLSHLLPTQCQTNPTPRSETTVPCSKPGSSSMNKPGKVQNGFPSSSTFPTPPSRYEQSPNSGPITSRSSPGAEPTRSPPVQQSTDSRNWSNIPLLIADTKLEFFRLNVPSFIFERWDREAVRAVREFLERKWETLKHASGSGNHVYPSVNDNIATGNERAPESDDCSKTESSVSTEKGSGWVGKVRIRSFLTPVPGTGERDPQLDQILQSKNRVTLQFDEDMTHHYDEMGNRIIDASIRERDDEKMKSAVNVNVKRGLENHEKHPGGKRGREDVTDKDGSPHLSMKRGRIENEKKDDEILAVCPLSKNKIQECGSKDVKDLNLDSVRAVSSSSGSAKRIAEKQVQGGINPSTVGGPPMSKPPAVGGPPLSKPPAVGGQPLSNPPALGGQPLSKPPAEGPLSKPPAVGGQPLSNPAAVGGQPLSNPPTLTKQHQNSLTSYLPANFVSLNEYTGNNYWSEPFHKEMVREMIRMDMTYSEVARVTGIKYSLLYSRYKTLRQNIQSNPTQ